MVEYNQILNYLRNNKYRSELTLHKWRNFNRRYNLYRVAELVWKFPGLRAATVSYDTITMFPILEYVRQYMPSVTNTTGLEYSMMLKSMYKLNILSMVFMIMSHLYRSNLSLLLDELPIATSTSTRVTTSSSTRKTLFTLWEDLVCSLPSI